jgi:hypothetical protein
MHVNAKFMKSLKNYIICFLSCFLRFIIDDITVCQLQIKGNHYDNGSAKGMPSFAIRSN